MSEGQVCPVENESMTHVTKAYNYCFSSDKIVYLPFVFNYINAGLCLNTNNIVIATHSPFKSALYYTLSWKC